MKGKEQTAEVCLLPVAAMLGRQEYILRTVTFVERYHSGVFCRECWSFSWIRGFSLPQMKGCKK